MQDKAPFKLALAALFMDNEARDPAAAMDALHEEYAHARFFTREFVAYQLHSLKAVGILQVDENGRYSITRSGAERVRGSL